METARSRPTRAQPPPEPGSARLAARVAGWLGAWLLRGLARTWRWQIRGQDPLHRSAPPPVLGALWHRDILLAATFFRDRGYAVPVSRSRDGDLVASAMVALGFSPPPRGSSSRGGVTALRALLRHLRDGTDVGVLVDGPRGPASVAKPGVVWISRRAGVPITPVAFAARPAWRFGSWDRTRLPLPFARIGCAFGEPLPVPRGDGPEPLERARLQLAGVLDALSEQLERDMRGRARGG